VGFDFDAGWSTAQANVARDADWLETAAEVAFIVGVGIVTSGAMAGFGFGGTSLGAVVATGAAVGGTTSIASGFIHDNLSFKNVLRGALSGALTAGLLNGIESALGPLSFLGKVAASTGVQGLVQAGLGGSFKDGALAGFASGLGQQIVASMSDGIKAAVNAGTMTPVQAAAAQTFARMLGSAVRVAANPGDPGQAFANAFLSDVMGQIDLRQPGQAAPGSQAAFDDNGRALPLPLLATPAVAVAPVVAPPGAVSAEVQLAPNDPFSVISSDGEVSYGDMLADQLGVPREDLVDAGLRNYAGRSAEVFAGFIEGAGFSVLDTGYALLEIAKSPGQFINGINTLLDSAEARAQFGEELVARVKVDVQMLKDAYNSGDLRGIGQQLGKLTADFAQVAGGVAALARLGVSTASAGGRLLISGVDELANLALKKVPGLFDAAGAPLMDFRALSNAQKGVIGELMGANGVQRLVPDAQRIGRTPGVGQQGIDDLYKVTRPDVDYVFVEYKFGSRTLGATADGLQMSDGWLQGTLSGKNRIAESLGKVEAGAVQDAIRQGRIEKWLVHTDPFGNVTVGLVDRNGKFIPQPISKVIKP
jgi:hypothetical protein